MVASAQCKVAIITITVTMITMIMMIMMIRTMTIISAPEHSSSVADVMVAFMGSPGPPQALCSQDLHHHHQLLHRHHQHRYHQHQPLHHQDLHH